MTGEYLTPVYEQNHTYEGVVYDAPDTVPKKDLPLNEKNFTNGSKTNLNSLPFVTKTLTNSSRANLITTRSDDVNTKTGSKKHSRRAGRCCIIAGIVSVLICLVLTAVNLIILLSIQDIQNNKQTSISTFNTYNTNSTWEWGLWGPCTAECGFGMKSRERYCGNKPCGDGVLDKDVCYLGKCKENTTPVGFSAKLTKTLSGVSKGSIIPYDWVDYNTGQGYDDETGIFTCPEDGAYLFIMFVQGLHRKVEGVAAQTSLVLMIDGQSMRSLVSEPVAVGHDETGGNALVKYMAKGQMAWIETYFDNNQTVYPGRSSFTGVLLR